jgi:hypothetical protein
MRMKNNHEITLKQYAAYCEEQPVYLGTADSYGMEMLSIVREGVWAEYDVLATFHPPVGAAVQVRVGVENCIDVPAEATAEKGMGEIVFAGYKEGVRQIAVDVLYKVAPSSGANGTEPAEPTPSVVQQIMSAANAAEKLAQSVRDDADAGKFTGAKGDKGDTGPRGEKGDMGEKGEPGKDGVQINDDAVNAIDAWSGQHVVDMLCPPLEVSGNPAQCYPVAGYPLGVKVSWEPTQEGSGTPSPENIRPIKGRDSVTITRQEDNQVITLTLPETVYGGEVDAVSGEGIKNWKRIVFDGTEKWDVRAANYTSYSLVLPIRSKTGFCTHFKKILYDAIRPDTGTGETGCYLESSLSAIFNVPFKNVTDWKNYLAAQYAAGTPVYIVYQYANEVNEPFAATGAQPIPALAGANTLLTDADSVSVSGRADLIHIIKKMQEK